MGLHCKQCLTSRTGDVLGALCKTDGCYGIIEEEPSFSTLVDNLPELITCQRRMRNFGPWKHEEGLDCWQRFKSNGDRVCSFCGSLHPDDFIKLMEACAAGDPNAPYGSVPEIEPSNKLYKIYIYRAGVRNAHEGGIKFYAWHLPAMDDSVREMLNQKYRKSVDGTQTRFKKKMAVDGVK